MLWDEMEVRIKGLTVKVLGGADEIGGNLILMELNRERIVLDAGVQPSKLKMYYTWPLRTPKSITELVELGISPKIDGFYASWTSDGKLARQEETRINGVFITHYHMDHCYLLPQINRRIPIYMGRTSKIFFDFHVKVKRRERHGIWNPTGLDTCIRTFRTGDEIECGNFRVVPVHVDHSIPGAYGFIVETKDAVVAYTGDFRMHGPRKDMTEDFIRECSERGVDLLITEGTNFFDVSSMSEGDVERRLRELTGCVRGVVLATFGFKDVDRFGTYFRVARETGREILMPYKQLLLLNMLREGDEKLRRVVPNLKSEIVTAYYKTIDKKLERELKDHNLEAIGGRKLDRRFLKGKIILSFEDVLQEIGFADIPEDTVAVFSESEPADEEGQIEYEKVVNWLRFMAIPSYRVHSSGHIYPSQLREIVRAIRPKRLEVIHSEHSDELKRYLTR